MYEMWVHISVSRLCIYQVMFECVFVVVMFVCVLIHLFISLSVAHSFCICVFIYSSIFCPENIEIYVCEMYLCDVMTRNVI